MPKIALIAHDKKKKEMVQLIGDFRNRLEGQGLFATGNTGKLLIEEHGLDIKTMASGPLGGDQQIGSLVTSGEVNVVIFLRDPLTAQPHEPDITALMRVCDVHEIPLATNIKSARIILDGVLQMDQKNRKREGQVEG